MPIATDHTPESAINRQATEGVATDPRSFDSIATFYSFYLTEHSNLTCRQLHFAGSTLSLACLVTFVLTFNPLWIFVGLLCGYGFAWAGHFGFEKNRPASFKRPLYSFMGDWRMYADVWTGKVRII